MTSLNIALIGYGRMGKEIEKAALNRGHRIVVTIDSKQDWDNGGNAVKKADVAIDFSVPLAAAANISRCFDLHLPIVVGTTGWQEHLPALKERCIREQQALFHSANFSVGVHIFMATARFLSQRMDPLPDYTARIEEIHHIHKLDKPSGTAIRLAENVVAEMNRYESWQLTQNHEEKPENGKIPVESLRIGETVGTHRLFFESGTDSLELIHTAKSRQGFAMGAIMAAEWLCNGKTGCFGMEDMLGL